MKHVLFFLLLVWPWMIIIWCGDVISSNLWPLTAERQGGHQINEFGIWVSLGRWEYWSFQGDPTASNCMKKQLLCRKSHIHIRNLSFWGWISYHTRRWKALRVLKALNLFHVTLIPYSNVFLLLMARGVVRHLRAHAGVLDTIPNASAIPTLIASDKVLFVLAATLLGL